LVVYVDSSAVLAQLLAVERRPPEAFWLETLTSSRLLEYEVWTRIHRETGGAARPEAAQALLGKVVLVELRPAVLQRALRPYPVPLRTLDALHVATLDHLRGMGGALALATYDRRMADAALAIGFVLHADVRPPR
jgi:predicted nucleic acid-binding protein